MKVRIILVVISFTFAISSCSNDDNRIDMHEVAGGSTLCLVNVDGKEYRPIIDEDTILHFIVPNGANLERIKFKLGESVHSASINAAVIESGKTEIDLSDFTDEKTIVLNYFSGTKKEIKIRMYDLPVLVINTPNARPIDSKEYRVEGTEIGYYDNDGSFVDLGTCGIRGRGNSSWMAAKKPYNIKLDKKHEILGMQKSKHWLLIANAYMDRTQMHNVVAYEMARMTDFSWVQDGRFVEVILNGKLMGLYYLCEKVRVEKGRIDINIMESSDSVESLMSGGYLLESAHSPGNHIIQTDYYNKSDAGNPFYLEIKEPDETLTEIQEKHILKEMNTLEKLISDDESVKSGKYRNLLDIESAINWLLVSEACVNREIRNNKNIFLYKDKGDILKFGPPWDFDAHTFGSSYYRFNEDTLMCPYYFRDLMNDRVFVNRLKEKWSVYRPLWVNEIPEYMDNLYKQIHRSALRNEEVLWPDWSYQYCFPEKSYWEIVQEMKEALLTQIGYMDNIIKSTNVH